MKIEVIKPKNDVIPFSEMKIGQFGIYQRPEKHGNIATGILIIKLSSERGITLPISGSFPPYEQPVAINTLFEILPEGTKITLEL